MKKVTRCLILLLSFFILNSKEAKAQWVLIPDPNFAALLATQPYVIMNGNLMDTTSYGVVHNNVMSLHLNTSMNLSGIEYFDNLSWLDIWGISNLSHTVTIPQVDNSITNISVKQINTVTIGTFPSNITGLTFYNVQNINIPTLPTSLLSLSIHNNSLNTLPSLPSSLTTLIVDCPLTSVAGLPNTITKLELNYCNFPSIPSLPSSLIELKITNNNHTGFLTLPALPNTLKKLICANNTYFNSLPALKNTKHLECNNNNIHILGSIPAALEYLNISYNTLVYLPIAGTSLDTVICNNNSLISIGILPNSLKFFNCSNNTISQFGINATNNLDRLICHHNLLTNLPQLNNSLHYLDASYNQFTSLPVMPLNLDTLICRNGLLTSVGALSSSSLKYIDLQTNYLSSLPELPPSLLNLNVYDNNLIQLPAIPGGVKWLDISYNQLQEVPELPKYMYVFYANHNNIHCFTNLPDHFIWPQQLTITTNLSQNQFTCVPNQTSYTTNYPLCIEGNISNNPSFCQNAANIVGSIYIDNNGDCTYGAGDSTINHLPVKLYSANNTLLQTTYSNFGIYYFKSVTPGTYKVVIDDTYYPIGISCGQSNTQTISLTTSTPSISNLNFSVLCDSIATNNYTITNVTNWGPASPGRVHELDINLAKTLTYYSQYCNQIGNSAGGSLVVTIDGPVHLEPLNNFSTPTTINGNVYSFATSSLDSLCSSGIMMLLRTDSTAQLGDNICVHVSLTSNYVGTIFSNNNLQFCYQVVNSYDPNMKEVYPINLLPAHQDWLTYTIHFQNTGNALAYTVKLRDTLDVLLDPSTFEFVASSHNAITTLNGRVLTARFENIMLPDSTSNHFGSMGYYQFRIKPVPNLVNGQTILNHANIFFDYNTAVVTNNTVNLVTCVSNHQQTFQLCHGDSIYAANHWISHAGTYIDTLQNSFGCDSIIKSIVNEIYIDTSITITSNTLTAIAGYNHYQWMNCATNSIMPSTVNNFLPTYSGEYQVVITGPTNCASNSACYTICIPTNTQQNITICSGDSIQVGLHWYFHSGNYIDTVQTNLGCDSIIQTTVNETIIDTVITLSSNTLTAQVGYSNYEWMLCNNVITMLSDTNQFTPVQSGSYHALITTQNGCTALSACVSLCIPTNSQQSYTFCHGGSVQIGSHWYANSGNYIDTLITNMGCDSIISTHVNVEIIDTSVTLNANEFSAPSGYVNYEWFYCNTNSNLISSNNYQFNPTQSGAYSVLITSQNQCTAISSCHTICIESNTQQVLNLCLGDSIHIGTHWYANAGTYIDTLNSMFGCDSTITSFISTISIDTSLQITGDSIFAVSEYEFYQWKDCATDSILQASANPHFHAPYDGNFQVTISDSASCEASSSCVPVITTRLYNLENKPSIQLYPNPTKGDFTLYIQHIKNSQLTFRIYDVSGSTVYSAIETTTNMYCKKHDVSSLARGLYFVEIQIDRYTEQKKLVIE